MSDADSGPASLEDQISYFLEDITYQGKADRTREAYERVLVDFRGYLASRDLSFEAANHRDCMAYVHQLRGEVAESTVATYASYLHRFYDYMVQVGAFDSNPLVLVVEEMNATMVIHSMAETDVREIMANERVNIATDGLMGESPHPRTFGTYPRVLGKYVRDENLLTLEEAIRKMTSLPARVMGLESKGLIREGMDADLVVLDPLIVENRATYDDPCRYPKGISHVIINGSFAVRDEEITGATPGQII